MRVVIAGMASPVNWYMKYSPCGIRIMMGVIHIRIYAIVTHLSFRYFRRAIKYTPNTTPSPMIGRYRGKVMKQVNALIKAASKGSLPALARYADITASE